MPPALGLFLDTTYRMHPDVCAFVSEVAYEGKLESEPGLERQLVAGDDLLAGAGIRYVPVPHEGNSTSSPEEAAEVARSIQDDEARAKALGVLPVTLPERGTSITHSLYLIFTHLISSCKF